MNKIYDHPGEFEFVAKSFTFDQSLFIENTEKECFSIGKERENISCRSQSHTNTMIWKKTGFGFQKERVNQKVSRYVNKIKSNTKESNKRRSFPWKKLAVFEKEKKIDQEEQKRKLFRLALSPKQLFFLSKHLLTKTKEAFKKIRINT